MSDQVPAFNLQILKDADLSRMSSAKLALAAAAVWFTTIEHSYQDYTFPFPNNLKL